MFKQLLSFYQRRLYIPGAHRGLILDVGSGDKPHFMADILVDKYVDRKHGIQRNGSDSVSVNKPLFVCDIADMPFKDKAFDYVIASHVLEHIEDPAGAIKEITRVGKAGYVEVPYIGYQKLIDFDSHLWYCDFRDQTITFTAKKQKYFDKDIENFVFPGIASANIIIKNEEHCIVKVWWKNNLKCKVVGKPSRHLIKQIEKSGPKGNSPMSQIQNIFNIFKKVYGFLLGHKSLHYNDLLMPKYHKRGNPLLQNRIYKTQPR